jgi:hypothetical protein
VKFTMATSANTITLFYLFQDLLFRIASGTSRRHVEILLFGIFMMKIQATRLCLSTKNTKQIIFDRTQKITTFAALPIPFDRIHFLIRSVVPLRMLLAAFSTLVLQTIFG